MHMILIHLPDGAESDAPLTITAVGTTNTQPEEPMALRYQLENGCQHEIYEMLARLTDTRLAGAMTVTTRAGR